MNKVDIINKWFAILDEIGVNEDGSTSRLGYTAVEDKMFEAAAKIGAEFGLKQYYDDAGNMFLYNGDNKGNYTVIGSHLDSVLNGGKFDGIIGVLGGLLIAKQIHDEKLNIPLKVACWRMEESSMYGIACVGSKLVAGQLAVETVKNAKNPDGVSLYDTITSYGYTCSPAKIKDLKQYLEIHIEQGKVLEAKGLPLGVVNSIAGPTRTWFKFIGNQDHSGATPMDLRNDSLVGAAELIVFVEKSGKDEMSHATVATTGIVRNTPNVFNVVPGETLLGVDIRGIDKASRTRALDNVKKKALEIANARDLKCEITHVSDADPVKLDDTLRQKLSDSAKALGIEHIVMPSGAGHDAMSLTEICPVGMLFIPCKGGISHNKEEYAKTEDIVRGCEVFMHYLKSTM